MMSVQVEKIERELESKLLKKDEKISELKHVIDEYAQL